MPAPAWKSCRSQKMARLSPGVALLYFCAMLSAAVSDSGDDLKWYLGCYDWSSLGFSDGLTQAPVGQIPNPVFCAKICLDGGYAVAALTSEVCHCSNQTEGFLESWHRNSSGIVSNEGNPTGRQNSTRCKPCGRDLASRYEGPPGNSSHISSSLQCPNRCSGPLCLPHGGKLDRVAVYRTRGPYIQNVSMSASTERVQTGKPFLLVVSGYLAAPQWQHIGIQGLRAENFSLIGVVFSWSSGAQNTYSVNVLDDGFFTISPDWTLANPGTYYINVTVSNIISTQSASMEVTAVFPSPTALEVTVVQATEDIPSCIPFSVRDTGALEKVFLGDTSTLRAFVATGVSLDFSWFFTDDASSFRSRADCHSQSECLTCSVNRTFEKEGIHGVTVNVSNIYGWTQKTIHVAVIPRVLSNLTLETRSKYRLAVGQDSSLHMEVFTTMRQLLSFNITLRPGVTHTHRLADGYPALQAPGHLQLAHTYGQRDCLLHVHLLYRYDTAGHFPVSLAVFSSTAVERAALPRPLQVFEPIRDLRPALLWSMAVASGANATLSVISRTDHADSAVVWTIARGNVTVINRTTEEWSLLLSLKDAGHYIVCVKAFNPISYASFCSPLLVQDAISGLSLTSDSPTHIQTGSLVMMQASITAGTNVTYLWGSAANSSLSTVWGTATHVFAQPGVHSVTVTAQNIVSRAVSDPLEFIVQDPAGGCAVDVPSTATVKQRSTMSFAVLTGTNMTVSLLVNGSVMYSNNNYVTGAEVMLDLVFELTGKVDVTACANNYISSINCTVPVLVMLELHTVTIEQLQPAVVGEDTILIAKVNGHFWSERNYLYSWTLPQNRMVCSGSPVMLLNFKESGTHLVKVTVGDSASGVSVGVLLNATESSAAPLLSHPAIAEVGRPAQFYFKNLSLGSSVDVVLGDGNITTISYATAINSFSHTYHQKGLYYIRVVSLSEEILSSVIDVQEPVEGLYIMGPDTFSLSVSHLTPSPVTWAAKVSRGSNYIYRWRFSNGRENISSMGSDQFSVEVSEPGLLRVEVTVENEVSRLSANLSTSVQYPIVDVSLIAKPVPLGQASNVLLTVVPWQHYDLFVDFGDGHRLLSSTEEHKESMDCPSASPCSAIFSFPHTYIHTGDFQLYAKVTNALGVVTAMAVAGVEEPISAVLLVLTSPAVIRQSDFIGATVSVETGSEVTFQWHVSLLGDSVHNHTDRNTRTSTLRYQAHVPGTYNVSVMISSPLYISPLEEHLSVKVCGPIRGIQVQFPSRVDHAPLLPQPDGSYTTGDLQFSTYTLCEDVTFAFDFGDGSPVSLVRGTAHRFHPGAQSSINHQFTEEGTFLIRVTAYNEFYNSTELKHVFYVEKLPASLHLTVNSSVVHKDEVILFNAHLSEGTNVTYSWSMGDQTTYINKGPVVSHMYVTAAEYTISVTAQNRVGSVAANTSVSVLYRIQPVSIYTDKQAYATNTDITFMAVTEEPGPLEFLWHFGDRPPQRTTSRIITKRYYIPDRYNVIVNASNRLSSFTSDIYPVVIQREVQANRLLFYTSVLLNASVNFDCRINAGTNVTYQWNFGDGTYRAGRNTEQHIFHRTGEFTVEVIMSNLVSSASLTGQIFVVPQPCQPPPVKNMGPLKLQVRRYQPFRLGVTYEAEIQCSISQGVLYSWTVYQSGWLQVQLPPVETQKQSIELPSNFLHYGTYIAVARVQIQGTVVYSNYTVRIEVVPSPPVSLIYGGTNIFISNSNSTVLNLNGQGSYDPDYPQNILSYTWDCKPVSRIQSPCFDEYVPASLSVITFPAGFLKASFDQFQFRLTVRSGDRTATSEVFVTVSRDLIRNVTVYCYPCQGNTVNWNEQFSVKAQCENCGISPRNILYTWKLYLVNASSKVVVDVPFCNSVDLSLPSSIVSLPPPATRPPQMTSGAVPPALATSTSSVPPPPNLTPPQSPPVHSTASSSPETPWPPEHPESQNNTAIMTSSITTSTTAKLPPTTPSPALFPPFPFPFPEESQSSGGRPRRERSAEPQGAPTSSDHPTPADLAPDFGRPPPLPGDYSIPIPPYYISEFPVFSDDGGMVYGSVSESDIISEFSSDFPFPPMLESSEVFRHPAGGSIFGGSSSWGTIIGPFPGPAPPLTEGDVDYGVNGTGAGKEEGGTSANQTFSFNSTGYEIPFGEIEEATGVSGSRPIGIGSGSSSGGEVVNPGSSGGEGDNLVDTSNQLVSPPEKTLLDLDRELIDPAVFQTLTFSGISSSIITFKPFMLKAKSLYMLEVSANSQQTLLGKTQFFFTTNEIPQGMTCQVQPSKGYEIHTDFSIFCTSGKEDLLYEYSFSVGNATRKILYRGTDFQYYFNLPSGDPDDDYKVTIYTEIRNRFGAATKPCPLSVRVLPSFQRNPSSVSNPDEELYVYGVRNLTNLMQMGNSMEIRNYIILLTNVLNRLSQDPAASSELLTGTRSALISAVCQLTISDQGRMIDNIYMLKELMSVTGQVTFESARLVTQHIQDISASFHEPSAPVTYTLNEWTVNSLVLLLSHALEASFSPSDEGIQLTHDGIRTTTDLMLMYVVLNKALQYSVSTRLMELKTSQLSIFQNPVNSAGSVTFYLPDLLETHTNRHRGVFPNPNPQSPCVISQLIFFKQNPYFWGKTPVQINGDIADLRLYNCTTRREIKVYSLSTPVNIEFQKGASNGSSASDFSLLRSQMNIHRFNVSPENLQEALQITVEFTRPASQTFPIMLLFRMFERPTPSLYNTRKIHRWEGDTVHTFLPPSSLSEAGTGFLGLLNADYNKTPRNKYISSTVNYTLRMESIQCLSWDGLREWRPAGCTPLQGLSSNKVNCSCSHLATFTAAYQEIQSHHEFTHVSQFVSVFNNLMLCSVIVISLAVYFLAMVVCKLADIQEEKKAGAVLLQDNSPLDRQLYTVTIDTGFRSRAVMTAKVCIVLHGEDGASQTREFNSPDNLLLDRNSRRTFILSTSESLGPISKVHLWHDNSGRSPSWYISHVVVKDLATGSSCFFPAECWLAVDEGDGRVERELLLLTQGLGFLKLLHLKLTEYLEDFHLWASVYACPSHSRFSHAQRLSVCLLLLEGYMCADAVLISLQDDQHTAELGLIDMSAVSLATGILSALAVLPVGGLVSLLFHWSKATSNKDSSAEQNKTRPPDIYSVEAHRDALLADHSVFESYLSWHNLQQWAQETWRKKHKRGELDCRSSSIESIPSSKLWRKKEGWSVSDSSSSGFEDGSSHDSSKPQGKDFKQGKCDLLSSCMAEHGCVLLQQEFGSSNISLPSWCRYLAWALCLSLSLTCIVVTGILGIHFSTTKSLLWIHSVFFSLLSCVFVVQPVLILMMAAVVSWWYRDRCDFYSDSDMTAGAGEKVKHWSQNGSCLSEGYLLSPYHHPEDQYAHLDKVLAARQRARYLRLNRPPTRAELRNVRDQMRKETLIRKTLREAILYIVMLFLLLFVTYGQSLNSQYQLNQAVRTEFTRGKHRAFQDIKTHDDWWNWTLTTLLDGLYWDTGYKEASAKKKAGAVQGTCILIGEPILKKIRAANKTTCKVPRSFEGLVPDCLPAYSPSDRDADQPGSSFNLALTGAHRHCGLISCYQGTETRLSLGRTRSAASVKLRALRDGGWLDRHARAALAQFTLYNPPSNLFTTVSLLAELPTTGGLLPSAFVESVRVYRTVGVLHYIITACELLFLLFILLQLYFQLCIMSQKGLLAYWRDAWHWLEVIIIIISLFYYICYVYHFILAVEIVDHLQRENFKAFVDLSLISSWEQMTRYLHGVIVFLFLVKSVSILRLNRVMAPSVTLLKLSLSKLLGPLVAGVVLLMAFSCLGNLLFLSTSYPFSSVLGSFQMVLTHCMGISRQKALSTLSTSDVSIAVFHGSFFFSVSIVWTALIIGILTSQAKTAKNTSRRKSLLTFSEVAAYIQDRVLIFLGRRGPRWIDNHAQRHNFYLEEFENLVDELLFRLNALSNSLHHTLPNKEQGYGVDESPPMSPTDYTCSLHSESTATGEDSMGKKTSKFKGMLFKTNPDIYNPILPSQEDSCDQNHLRSKLELETFQYLQQSQNKSPAGMSSESSEVSHSPQHTVEAVSTGGAVEVSAVLPGSVELPCSSASGTPVCCPTSHADHCNLPRTGDDKPHVLCGTSCSGNQVAHSRTQESRMSHSSVDLSDKKCKGLRRSHITVIQPLSGIISRDWETALHQGSAALLSPLCPNPLVSSLSTADHTEAS